MGLTRSEIADIVAYIKSLDREPHRGADPLASKFAQGTFTRKLRLT